MASSGSAASEKSNSTSCRFLPLPPRSAIPRLSGLMSRCADAFALQVVHDLEQVVAPLLQPFRLQPAALAQFLGQRPLARVGEHERPARPDVDNAVAEQLDDSRISADRRQRGGLGDQPRVLARARARPSAPLPRRPSTSSASAVEPRPRRRWTVKPPSSSVAGLGLQWINDHDLFLGGSRDLAPGPGQAQAGTLPCRECGSPGRPQWPGAPAASRRPEPRRPDRAPRGSWCC